MTSPSVPATSYPNPVPSGTALVAAWQANQLTTPPAWSTSIDGSSQWTATVLLSPFGDSISPLPNCSQLVVGQIESKTIAVTQYLTESYMRVSLCNTQDLTWFDFMFCSTANSATGDVLNQWYWLDSTPNGPINQVLGPFETTLAPPSPTFLADNAAQWANLYDLMGFPCNHWVLPTPGSSDHGTWCAYRQDTGQLLRMFMMDSTNPLMLPIIGSYYICNFPTFAAAADLSAHTHDAIERIQRRDLSAPSTAYWNPLVTQEDIHRAMAFPLTQASCTAQDIQAFIPGFVAMPEGASAPQWSDQTYIEGWTLGTDMIPYWTRVSYLWTGDSTSQQQSVFAGLGLNAGLGTYLQRTDSCLDTNETAQPYYTYSANGGGGGGGEWSLNQCLPPLKGVGLPYPDWLARDNGVAMGQVTGNAAFGLQPGETINFFAASLPRGGGAEAIFWLWFTAEGNGVLFTEGNYINPLSHNLQLIDYTLFVQNAGLTQASFENPCGWTRAEAPAQPTAARVTGHGTTTGAGS